MATVQTQVSTTVPNSTSVVSSTAAQRPPVNAAASARPSASSALVHPADHAAAVSNPWDGQYSTAQVKVDPWHKGDNDCLERMLMNQGFTREQIYSTKNGRSLLQQVAERNGLHDPNMIRNGRTLTIPSTLHPADEHTHVLNSQGLKPGQSDTATVGTSHAAVDATVTKRPDGTKTSTVQAKPETARAGLTETDSVSRRGRITVEEHQSSPTQSTADVTARSGDDTARTESTVKVKPDQTAVHIEDRDRTPGNMQVQVGNGQVDVTNPAHTPGDDVKTKVDIGVHHSNGWGARAGRWVNDEIWGEAPNASLSVNHGQSVDIKKDGTGQSTVTVTQGNGEKKTVVNPGESGLERAGETVDHGVGAAVDAVKKVWNWL